MVNDVRKVGVTQPGGEGGAGWMTNSSYDDRRYNNTEILRTGGLKTFSSKNRKDLAI